MMMMMSRLGFWTLERGHQHHPHHRSPKRRNNFATGGKTYALLNLIMPKRRGEKISKNVHLKNFNFFFCVFGKTKKKKKKEKKTKPKRDDDDIIIIFIVGQE